MIAGIGSRKTPASVLSEMTVIGVWCQHHGVGVRSGHAEGADYAFEVGAETGTFIYLPFSTFNAKMPILGYSKVVNHDLHPDLAEIAADHHPKWPYLNWLTRAFHTRNVAQVLGLPEEPLSAAVVCWTVDGGPTGGTGQAIRIATASGIPVLNMFDPQWDSAEKVIAWLSATFPQI